MSKKLSLLATFLVILFLVSCGQNTETEEYTMVRFNQPSGRPVTLNKGAMIIAFNQSMNKTLGIYGSNLGNMPQQVFLPNGQYLFFIFGYDGANPPFTSDMYCGIANGGSPLFLNGSEVEVNLGMVNNSASSCPGIFAPAPYVNGAALRYTTLNFCTSAFNTSSLSSFCLTPLGAGAYVEVAVLRSGHLLGGGPEPVFKICENMSSSYAISGLKIPFGPYYKISVKRFADNSCLIPANNLTLILDVVNTPVLTGSNTDLAQVLSGNVTVYILNTLI